MIKNLLKTTYSHQKYSVKYMRRDLKFYQADMVYLKISPMKGVVRFGNKWNLSPRNVGSHEIFQRFCKVSYKFKLFCKLA